MPLLTVKFDTRSRKFRIYLNYIWCRKYSTIEVLNINEDYGSERVVCMSKNIYIYNIPKAFLSSVGQSAFLGFAKNFVFTICISNISNMHILLIL